jgi:hypothetical protein
MYMRIGWVGAFTVTVAVWWALIKLSVDVSAAF